MGDHLALGESSNLTNFLKGDAVGPGRPNNPIWTVFGRLWFFDPGNRVVGLLRFHSQTSY